MKLFATCPAQPRVLPPAQPVGIYIHVPFCENGKCPYCDFYSVKMNEELKKKYIEAVERDIKLRAIEAKNKTVDTVYFGGGTPSLLREGLARLLFCIFQNFNVSEDVEITFEANPASVGFETLKILRDAGFNRLSLGMQSASDEELKLLGRRHRRKDVALAVENAHRAGLDNISLDLMMCIPDQTKESLEMSVDFAASLDPRHISAYLLKIEKGTQFFNIKETLGLPNDDEQADMYLFACEALEKKGFLQYEISNFAQKGYESRHNLKYWNCDEYLGFGPASHSFFNGNRFFYSRSLKDYIAGNEPLNDGKGGNLEEYIMLRLRLQKGIEETELNKRFGIGFEFFSEQKINQFKKAGLVEKLPGRLSFTKKGFLVSNSLISELLFQ